MGMSGYLCKKAGTPNVCEIQLCLILGDVKFWAVLWRDRCPEKPNQCLEKVLCFSISPWSMILFGRCWFNHCSRNSLIIWLDKLNHFGWSQVWFINVGWSRKSLLELNPVSSTNWNAKDSRGRMLSEALSQGWLDFCWVIPKQLPLEMYQNQGL